MSIKVLIIEDSPTAAGLLKHIITEDTLFEVVGIAARTEDAFPLIEMHRPDVLTLDLHLPGMDGYSSAKYLVQKYRLPILVVTGTLAEQDVVGEFKALDAGALAVVRKPPAPGDPDFQRQAEKIRRRLKDIVAVKVGYRDYVVEKTLQKVLIVEDNPLNAELMISLLEADVIEHVWVQSGEACMDYLEDSFADLIIMDIALPGMSGFEAMRLIKENPRLEDIPIVVVTAHAMAYEVQRMRESGCHTVITKPIDTRSFVNQLRAAFDRCGPHTPG